ncbi:MAG: hypothetical protein EAZ21_16380, partial [Betaproteobacteria bacterium]
MRFRLSAGLFVRRAMLASLVVVAWWAQSASNLDVLQSSFQQRWGAPAQPRFENWRKLVGSLTESSDQDRIKRVNTFFNQQVQFGDDPVIWGQA